MSAARAASVVSLKASAPLLLEIASNALDLVHHAQQVSAPELCDLLLGISAADELQRHVERLARVAPADDAAAAIEIRRDADVVDADLLHRVVDMIDEVLHGGGGIARGSPVDVGALPVVFRAAVG